MSDDPKDHALGHTEFLHGAPGAVDCWDSRARCTKCGTEFIWAGNNMGQAIKMSSYRRKVGTSGNRWNVRAGWPFTKEDELEACDLILLQKVHES